MKSKLILIAIIILASVLRLYKLSSNPVGLNADEAALGYNAYSLMTTGRDEHGHPWPVNLESFGDFKPALYSYILIPFIKVFGLTEFAVRLPSALFGILGVLGIYLLVNELTPFPSLYQREGSERGELGLLAAFILAISPWAIHFSRGAWEVNVATTLILIGLYSFVKWLKNSKFLWLGICGLGFVLSMYTYQSARLITPVLGLGLAVMYFKQFLKFPKQVLTAGVALILILTPLAISIVKSDAASRFSGVGLLADQGPVNRANEARGQHPNPNSIVVKVLHNRQVEYFIRFLSNYTDHFQGNYLFVNGDAIGRNKVPETGLLYLTDFIFLAMGVVFLLRTMNHEPRTKIIWLLLFISPLAAAITFQTPHALRSQIMVIPIMILVSLGVYSIFSSLKNLKFKNLIFICYLLFIICYFWQVSRYLHEYYIHYPLDYPTAWEYGFKELVPFVESVQDKYQKIIVTDSYDQPYILFLFYSKYPPAKFQNNHTLTVRDQYNFSTVKNYGKFYFESTNWDQVRDIHNALIVANPKDLPAGGYNLIKTINFPNGQPAFKIISN